MSFCSLTAQKILFLHMNNYYLFEIIFFAVPAPGRAVDWEAGEVCELHQAELWCKDLHLHAALHTGLPDLSHRG